MLCIDSKSTFPVFGMLLSVFVLSISGCANIQRKYEPIGRLEESRRVVKRIVVPRYDLIVDYKKNDKFVGFRVFAGNTHKTEYRTTIIEKQRAKYTLHGPSSIINDESIDVPFVCMRPIFFFSAIFFSPIILPFELMRLVLRSPNERKLVKERKVISSKNLGGSPVPSRNITIQIEKDGKIQRLRLDRLEDGKVSIDALKGADKIEIFVGLPNRKHRIRVQPVYEGRGQVVLTGSFQYPDSTERALEITVSPKDKEKKRNTLIIYNLEKKARRLPLKYLALQFVLKDSLVNAELDFHSQKQYLTLEKGERREIELVGNAYSLEAKALCRPAQKVNKGELCAWLRIDKGRYVRLSRQKYYGPIVNFKVIKK